MTLSELVAGRPTTSTPIEDYALMLRERIDAVDELELEVQRLRDELDDVHDREEAYANAIGALRHLVDAIDGSRVGKICKVGALVIVEDAGRLGGLGEALTAAKALL